MSEQLEFVLRMKDMFSGMLPKIANVSASTFGGVNSNINQTQMNLNRLSGPVKINVDSSGLKQAQTDIAGVNERMGMLGTSAAMAIGTGIERVVERGISFAREQIGDVFNQGLQGSALKVQYNVMAGKEEGTKLYGDLTKYIQDSIFGNELYGDAKVLLSYGDAAKNVMPDIKMLGDIAMGDAEKMKGLTVAFGQVMSTGHLMGQDLNQMIQGGGFNPLMVIAERTHGKNSIEARYQELKDLGEQGKISFGMIRSAFETATSEGGKFYHMLDEIGRTPFGKKAAMEGNIDNAKLTLGTALLPSMTHFMDTLKPVIDELPNDLLKLQPAIDSAIHGFADMIKWTANNTEALGKLFGVVKVGVEAYAAWKVGTVAMTAANWLWMQSMTGAAATSTEVTGAMALENEAILLQTEEVGALRFAWASMAEAKAASIAAQGAFSLPINTMGVAGGANVAAAGLFGAASRAVIPVTIAYFMGSAIAQMLPKGSFGYDKEGNEIPWYDIFSRDDARQERMHKYLRQEHLAAHPVAWASGWDATDMLGVGKSLSSTILDKYGVKAPGAGPSAKDAITDATDAITGGGKRVININFKNFVEHLNNNVNSKAEGQAWTEGELKEMLARVLAGVPK